MKNAKDIVAMIKNEPWSVVILFFFILLPPIVYGLWSALLPESLRWLIIPCYFLVLFIILILRRKEIAIWRRKTMLFNYLKKDKRHSIKHLSKEWGAKDEFTEKNIKELLLKYPNIFKRVRVKSKKRTYPGVGLTDEVLEKLNN